jgi:hypothetical protein
MQVQLPIFILCLLLHTGIFLTSGKRDRKPRFIAALLFLSCTWPVWYAGLLLEISDVSLYQLLGLFLEKAPYYLPFCTFLVYIRRRNNPLKN